MPRDLWLHPMGQAKRRFIGYDFSRGKRNYLSFSGHPLVPQDLQEMGFVDAEHCFSSLLST